MHLRTLIDRLQSLRYLVRARPLPLEKPVVLQFPVVDHCNSHCQMCRIWANRQTDCIGLDALSKGLRNPLFSEVRTVGINGGEPTLREDLPALTEVLFGELPSLRAISLITNGYNSKQVITQIGALGTVVRAHGGRLDVMVSLDGVGELHDRVRGKPGNFERARAVIDFALASPLVDNVRIGCTIVKDNVYGLHDLLEYCQEAGLYVKFRLGVPHQRLYTADLREPYDLDEDEKYHAAEFLASLAEHYETQAGQRYFYRSLIGQLLDDAPRTAGCDWQHRGATITARGELQYCAVHSRSLGLIQEIDAEQAYFGNRPHLREIVASQCAGCRHDYAGLPPRREQLRQTVRRALVLTGLERPLAYLLRGPLRPLREARSFRRRERRLREAVTAAGRRRPVASDVRQVLVCGWYGTETLGDKAILAGVLAALRQGLPGAAFTIASLHPHVTQATRRQMPELAGTEIVDAERAIALATDMDLVVFGGGPLMAVAPLAEMKAIFQAARNHGVATLVAGCGVGPLGGRAHNRAIADLLNLADLRIYRDQRSRELARGLGIEVAGDLVAEDPAFTWLAGMRDTLPAERPAGARVLLLGLRDFPWQAYGRHLGQAACVAAKARYETAVVAALERLVARHEDMVIRPLPMCTHHFGSDDRWFYRRLFRGRPVLQARLDPSLLGRELPPLDYCRAFRTADAALTMRFHSLVFALALGLPAVAIDYTLGRGKVDALARQFGVPLRSLDELDADFLVDAIERQLDHPARQSGDFTPRFAAELLQRLPGLMARTGS